MFIRRKPNKSGTYSVHVLDKKRGRYTLVRSFGASRSEDELSVLERQAADFISSYGGQAIIDFERLRQSEEVKKA